jgi:polyphenol oxidase
MPSLSPIATRPDTLSIPTALTDWEIPGLVHGFGGRDSGVSVGPFASFNLARWVGDDPLSVAENWRRWNACYPNFNVALLSQVHGKLVHKIDRSGIGSATVVSNHSDVSRDGNRPEGDGMVTATAGIALGIFTADCVPTLMVDADRRIVGALHAGWRGTIAGIAAEGVSAMVALGARAASIRAALGPSIGLCCFEVDTALAEDFARRIPGAAAHSRNGRPGKSYLDLRAILRDQLQRAGLEAASITNVGPCTRCANDLFFSRRAVGGRTTGLQMSFIGFTE